MYIHVQKLILNDEASAAFYMEIEIFWDYIQTIYSIETVCSNSK